MKKIINNRLYDTDTAKELGSDSYLYPRDFAHWEETLYIKRTGEYFLHGVGGPSSKYAVTIGQNSWSGGEKIIPLTMDAARQWAEDHLSADDYAAVFGLPDEGDDSKTRLNIQLPARLLAEVRDLAAASGESLTACVERLLRAGMGA